MRFLPFGISIPCGSGELEVDGGTLELPEAFGLGVPAVGEVGVEEGEAEALCKPGVGLEIAAGPAFGAVLVWHPVMKMTIAIVAK